jgi:hypothetical protein
MVRCPTWLQWYDVALLGDVAACRSGSLACAAFGLGIDTRGEDSLSTGTHVRWAAAAVQHNAHVRWAPYKYRTALHLQDRIGDSGFLAGEKTRMSYLHDTCVFTTYQFYSILDS